MRKIYGTLVFLGVLFYGRGSEAVSLETLRRLCGLVVETAKNKILPYPRPYVDRVKLADAVGEGRETLFPEKMPKFFFERVGPKIAQVRGAEGAGYLRLLGALLLGADQKEYDRMLTTEGAKEIRELINCLRREETCSPIRIRADLRLKCIKEGYRFVFQIEQIGLRPNLSLNALGPNFYWRQDLVSADTASWQTSEILSGQTVFTVTTVTSPNLIAMVRQANGPFVRLDALASTWRGEKPHYDFFVDKRLGLIKARSLLANVPMIQVIPMMPVVLEMRRGDSSVTPADLVSFTFVNPDGRRRSYSILELRGMTDSDLSSLID